MANTITGKILMIGQTEVIPYQDKTFYKRELVLDASRFDQYSGQKFENYPKFEFTGNNCMQLDQFQIGQVVTVSFVLSGRRVEKNGMVTFFTNVAGYKVEPYVRQNQSQQVAQPQQTVQTVTKSVQPSYQPEVSQQFPAALDENGNPLGGEDGDLPF